MPAIKFYDHQPIPMEMHKVKIVQQLTLPPADRRLAKMKEAGFNTFQLHNGYYQLLLNGEPWDARNTRLFCKDPDGKDMIFASRGTEITYQGKKILNSESGYAELIQTMAEKEFTVDRDYFFLMGDHRNNSNDSRNVGAVDRSMIVGHVRQIVFPFNKWRGVQ